MASDWSHLLVTHLFYSNTLLLPSYTSKLTSVVSFETKDSLCTCIESKERNSFSLRPFQSATTEIMVLQKNLNQNALHFTPQIPSLFQPCHVHDAEERFFQCMYKNFMKQRVMKLNQVTLTQRSMGLKNRHLLSD